MINKTDITYVANAGVLLSFDGKKILIDALCDSRLPIYKNTSADICNKIIKGIAPYDNIDLMLITHNHGDHFDAKMIGRFLEQNYDTLVISTDRVVSELRSCIFDPKDPRLIEVNPQLYCAERIRIKGIDIQAISMAHDGKEYSDVKNLAFLIEYGRTILHVGDAAPTKNNYQALKGGQYNIDLLIANFPYVGLPVARQIVKDYIDPGKIAVVHLPIKEHDRFNWIPSTKKSYERVKESFYQTEFLEEVGLTINMLLGA
ncbi:MAG: hypothetical protein APF84_06195 [Gracilibacter sp. BRH_c7a]|nr:MAG: hypothetical protein APF84_06195 [Gracilibacter sp. BRH_c7a]